MNNLLAIHDGNLEKIQEVFGETSTKSCIMTSKFFQGDRRKRAVQLTKFLKKFDKKDFKYPIYNIGDKTAYRSIDRYDNIFFKTSGYFAVKNLGIVCLVLKSYNDSNVFQSYIADSHKPSMIFIEHKEEAIVFTDDLCQLIYSKNPKLVVFFGNKKFNKFKFPLSETQCISLGRSNTILYDIGDGALFILAE